jgi:NAD(P)-dependent dehydrogenase (short-subunit alcohol dehydrogenase family)
VHSLDSFEKLLKVNLVGTFDVTRQVSKHMTGGVIVLVASINAYQAYKFQTAYAASKGAVASMAMPLSRDLAYKGTRVVSISPGGFDTPMTQPMRDKTRAEVIKAIPSGRMGKPEEFAHAVWFAVENEYLNGCNLDLNGGLVNPNI